MSLANINYNLSVDEQAISLAIDNSPKTLEIIDKGLFIAARRHLGYTPRASSFPFITRGFNKSGLKNSVHDRNDLAHAMNHHVVATPDSDDKFKGREVITLGLTIHSTLVYDVISEINLTCDPEDKISPWHHNTTAIMMAAIEDRWNDMVIFAKEHDYYQRNWMTFAYNTRTQQAA